MHVHIPKPIHGWKAFANEIVIIVIGVLIALGLEQVVEEVHWRHKVVEGEDRLRVEAQTNVSTAAEAIVTSNCEVALLARMRAAIASSGNAPLRLEAYPVSSDRWLVAAGDRGNVLPFVPRLYSAAIWTALNSDGTLNHFPPERQRELAGVYAQIARLDEMSRATRVSQGELAPLADGLVLDAAARLSLAQAVGRAETQARYRLLMAEQMMLRMRVLGLAPSRQVIDDSIGRNVRRLYAPICDAAGAPLIDWYAAIAPYDKPHLYR